MLKRSNVLFLSALSLIFFTCSYFQEPDIPAELTAVYNASEDVVELRWDDVKGAREYIVYRGSSVDDLQELTSGEDGSYNDYDYDYYHRFYAVEAENDVGSSGLSQAVEADLNNYDKYEPNNSPETATPMPMETNTPGQKHSIMPSGDVDYIKFFARPSRGYNMEAPAASAFPLKMTLYDGAGNELASDSEGEDIYIVRIGEWTPTVEGYYTLKLEARSAAEEGYYRLFIHEWE